MALATAGDVQLHPIQCQHEACEARSTEDRMSVWPSQPASIFNVMIKMFYFYKHNPPPHCFITSIYNAQGSLGVILYGTWHGKGQKWTRRWSICDTGPHGPIYRENIPNVLVYVENVNICVKSSVPPGRFC